MSAFVVGDDTMHRVVWAIHYDIHEARWGYLFDTIKINNEDDLNKLGQMLYDMNTNAVNQRYRESDDPPVYRWKPSHDSSVIQNLKSMRCLSYQCCEGNVPETRLYAALEQAINTLCWKIINDLTEYKEAEWG